ncbi:hypothetical protein OHC33_008466 [Knufia fluminis]|uniref:RING-type domain-containing protein n=2 Tax=Knufia TaxID=430999 RepID=A0AAN8EAX8_9EURO|nr:hypothetical protein OHC33_008466 [Knufia fluminis]
MALASQPPINLGDGVRRNIRYAEEHDELGWRASKRMKVVEPSVPLPKCNICSEEINGAHSKPCFYCKSTWCYECLQNQFTASLDDQEQFPAKCCGKVLHFDVARSVVPELDYMKYKTRFEQHHTTKPIYCANPRCSTFLPTRVSKPDNRGQVLCPDCNNTTCIPCKAVVDPTESQAHKCVAADETTALLKQFDYKRCPRCDIGVAKMYGCSHVRCQCGAHWCWDCQRPIQVCWSKPCERAREDGDETDEYNVPEEESESEDDSEQTTPDSDANPSAPDAATTAVIRDIVPQQPNVEVATEVPEPQQAETVPPSVHIVEAAVDQIADRPDQVALPAVVTPTEVQGAVVFHTIVQMGTIPIGEPAPAPASTSADTQEPVLNLDADDADDWEAGDFDFGDEPNDETWDTWGCYHHFHPVFSNAIWQGQKEWLPDTLPVATTTPNLAKQVDCLKCYKTIILTEPVQEDSSKQKDKDKDTERPDSACDVSDAATLRMEPASASAIESATPAEQPGKKDKKKRKNKKQGDIPSLFNCARCGVFYCVECKKVAAKEINLLLQKREVRG